MWPGFGFGSSDKHSLDCDERRKESIFLVEVVAFGATGLGGTVTSADAGGIANYGTTHTCPH